jgi:Gluconate 2-dehydrogenase subunit 3
MRRRVLLQWVGGVVAALRLPVRLRAQPGMTPAQEATLASLAEAVLPTELGRQATDLVVAEFRRWHREYRADAETDHGYGVTRLRRTPAAPAARYAAQFDALETQARARGQRFADLPLADRRAIVERAIADAKVERLPARPDGGHVATDLMGFYFNSVEANDRCYRRAIGRDLCRGLDGSGERPAPLAPGGR